MHTRIVLLAVALLGAGALPIAPRSAIAQPTGARRFVADSFWTRQWSRGGEREAELLVEPRQIVVRGGVVVLLDLGTREVVGLDRATGRTRFVLTARGEGPGEFKRPLRIVETPTAFAVLDQATSRLTAFDSSGHYLRGAASPNPFVVDGLCVRRDGSTLYKTSGAKDALVHVDSSGRSIGVRSLPLAPREDLSLASSGFLVGPDPRGACAFVARYGPEWLVVPVVGAIARHRYVTAPPPPKISRQDRTLSRREGVRTVERTQVTQGQSTASGAMLRGDTLIVRGYANGRLAYRVLDYYLLPSGRYLHSRRLPLVFAAVSIGDDGTFIGVEVTEEGGVAHAFRPSLSRGARPSRDSVVRRPPPAPARRGVRP